MIDDDDALDRALLALPLEEPPPDLHARIMAATVYAPARAESLLPGWELWLVVLASSLSLWLGWAFLATPHLLERLTTVVEAALAAGTLTSASTALWVALGISAACWITQFSVPQPQPQRMELRR
jgi:hypothetical protein